MPHIFTNAKYADMLYVYGFCVGSATVAVDMQNWGLLGVFQGGKYIVCMCYSSQCWCFV
jgi:phosphoserine aminotransferase